MAKKIYFVRRGESEGNIGAIVQRPGTTLTKKGEEQAEIVAKRLANLEFDLLVASSFKRAQQTAEAISKATGKEIITNDLFIERIKPSEQIGKEKDGPIAIQSNKNYDECFIKGEKYKDGESFEEISTRAKNCLKFLERKQEENIVVVTHGMFLRVIFAVILLKKHITPETCFEIMRAFKTYNTGVTMISKENNEDWRLVVWNDHAHFADF